jgi:hypothetical protein
MQPLSIYLILIMIFQFSGCAKTTSTVSVAPITDVMALPAHNTQSEFVVGADPYYSTRQKAMFGQDMSQRGILPIMVYLQNNGAQPSKVVPNIISLKFQDGGEEKAISRATIIPDSPLPLGVKIAFIVAWLVFPPLEKLKQEPNFDMPLMGEEYEKKELREVTLSKGELAQGFVYFYIPQRIQHAKGAHLIVPYQQAKGRAGEVRVPLGGM